LGLLAQRRWRRLGWSDERYVLKNLKTCFKKFGMKQVLIIYFPRRIWACSWRIGRGSRTSQEYAQLGRIERSR
jgi:hypothetical protein